MKTEQIRNERAAEPLHYDAHEFDGLRSLEAEAQSFVAKSDQFVRRYPWLCIGLAVAAGFSIIYGATRRK